MNTLVISSFAKDYLILENKIEIRDGGPALFITKVLSENKIPFRSRSGKTAIVEIDLRNNQEKGRIKRVDPIRIRNYGRLDFVIISTLLNEYRLKAIGKFCCLDIQGYVRVKNTFWKKKLFDSKELEKFDVVKATEEELKYIPQSRVEKIKLLLITKGENGFDVVEHGKIKSFSIQKIYPTDTVGAGDTFFTAFCLKYNQTRDIIKSSKFAKETVVRFLKQKQAGGI